MRQAGGVDLGLAFAYTIKHDLSKAVEELVTAFAFDGETAICRVGIDMNIIHLVFGDIGSWGNNNLDRGTFTIAIAIGDGHGVELVAR